MECERGDEHEGHDDGADDGGDRMERGGEEADDDGPEDEDELVCGRLVGHRRVERLGLTRPLQTGHDDLDETRSGHRCHLRRCGSDRERCDEHDRSGVQ